MPEADQGHRPILIAGAGIAGLALGIGLARRGLSARILERRVEPMEAGAGIQLSPNAMQVLRRLGVADTIEERAGRPEAIVVADGASGRRLARFPLGVAMEQRFGAPYRVVHRADLHAALLGVARATAGLEISAGFEVTRWRTDGDDVVVSALEGAEALGTSLIGADGTWSAVRRRLFPDHPLTYAGKMAVRTLLPMSAVSARFREPVTGVWLGQAAHVVHYPVRANREIAVVVIVDEGSPREGWGGEIGAVNVQARLVRFSSELLEFLSLASEWRAWSLYDPPPLPGWSDGNVGLIGDAAHPILPFLAQGGAMALENAETLSGLLAAHPADPAAALQRMEALRRPRVQRVAAASRENGRVFHLGGALGLARNLVLGAVPGSMMMRRYDWLYGWNGDAAVGS